MLTHLRHNVVAYLALFVALSGTSYAAVTLAKDSVTAKQIKAGSVRTDEVKDKSLQARDFKSGELPAGPQGPQGATGPAGPSYGFQGTTPPAFMPPTNANFSASVTNLQLPTAGKVYVYAHISFKGTCSSGGVVIGLLAGGVPVPGTGRGLPNNTTITLDLRGITATSVPAGMQTVTLVAGCSDGVSPVSNTQLDAAFGGAILVGS
jgi:hypothetical protein